MKRNSYIIEINREKIIEYRMKITIDKLTPVRSNSLWSQFSDCCERTKTEWKISRLRHHSFSFYLDVRPAPMHFEEYDDLTNRFS